MIKAFILILLAVSCCSAAYRPTVLWHGMGDTCCLPFSMGHIKKLIEETLPGIFVYSIEVGPNMEADEYNGYFMPINTQIEYVHEKLKNMSELAGGFNAMGFSQGGQFLRAYVERYNDPPVYNLISVGGQHQGVFGMPQCMGNRTDFCEIMRKLLNIGAYEPEVQSRLVQAEYWQDPLNREEYLEKCIFLPDINNAKVVNETYKQNFIALNHLTLVKFEFDTMVQPRESEWFGFYAEGQDKEVINVQNTTLYLEDTIGLKTLMDNNKVDFIPCPGNHLQFTDAWFVQYLVPYINNTLQSS